MKQLTIFFKIRTIGLKTHIDENSDKQEWEEYLSGSKAKPLSRHFRPYSAALRCKASRSLKSRGQMEGVPSWSLTATAKTQ